VFSQNKILADIYSTFSIYTFSSLENRKIDDVLVLLFLSKCAVYDTWLYPTMHCTHLNLFQL